MDLKGSHALATALSTSAKEAWRHYTTIQTCEPSAAAVLVSQAARKRRQHQRSPSPDLYKMENEAGDFGSELPDRRKVENEAGDFSSQSPDQYKMENEAGDFSSELPDRYKMENEAGDFSSQSPDQREVGNEADDRGSGSPDRCPERAVAPMSRVLAESLVSELRVQQLLVGASKQETLRAEAVRGIKILAISTQPTVAPPFTEGADKPPPLNCPDGAGSINSYLAESLGRELRAQQQSVAAQEQEARFVAARDASGSKIGEEAEEEEATLATESKDKPPPLNCPDGAGSINSYLAESLSRELRAQQQSVAAQEQEARFVAAVQRKDASGSKIGEEEEEEEATLATEPLAEYPRLSDGGHIHTTSATLEAKPAGVYLAESLVSELRSQQLAVQLQHCEAKHVKAVLSRDRPKHSQLPADTVTSNSDDHTVHSTPDPTLLATKLPEVVPKLTVTTAKELKDAFSQTSSDLIPTAEAATSTPTRDLHTSATNTEPLELQDAGVNTVLSYNKLMKSAQATEKYKKLQAEHKAAVKELRQEKSQRMTSEQLVKIVQTDLSSVQQRNVAETTARLQLESELAGVKAELGYARKQIEDKDQRISELEDSLTGTSLLVRKLEEQNAVALMNRGGIDYMVQAKLAEGRAQEAEQKLRVLQVDLLQSQNEVKQLLDRVAGAARERSEMVSSKVHVQLLQIADDRALAAEQRAQELEKEVQDLKRKLSAEKPMTNRNNGFPSLSLSSSFPFTPYSGYSLPSYPTTLSSGWETKPLTSTANGSHSSFGSSSYLGSVGLGSTGSAFSSSLRTPSDTSALPKLHESLITATPSSSYPSDNKQGVPPDTESGSSATGSVLYTPSLLPTTLKPHALSTALPKLNEADTTAHLVQTKAATEGSSLGLGVDLPSYDPSRVPDPTPVPTSTPRLKSQADGDSSDWSSSDEDTDTNPFMPSTHANLTAQWEWRSRQDSASADSTATASAAVKPATTSAAVKPVAHTPTTKRRPPPIAPKPNLRKPLEHEPGHTMGETLRIAQELPCSFEEPARKAGLQLLTTGFRRPRGPRGRNLPSRYLKKQKGLFF